MEQETISKLIPVTALLVLGILEALGGLYLDDNRTKNDFTIELGSLVTLPTLIQPGIFLFVFWAMGFALPGLEDYFVASSAWWHFLAFLVFACGRRNGRAGNLPKRRILLCINARHMAFSCFNLFGYGLCLPDLSSYKISDHTIGT